MVLSAWTRAGLSCRIQLRGRAAVSLPMEELPTVDGRHALSAKS